MDVLADLEARGLVQDTTDRDELRTAFSGGPARVYYGCDPTADSLHVGNLIGLLVLRRLQAAGHHPIALAGGATGMVGDPSGRSEERNLLDAETLAGNVAAIKGQIARILGDDADWTLVDNVDWTGDLRLVDFLRDVGKHATVNQMVARESVKARMEGEHGISFTEFTYMLLQANDYLWLYDNLGCVLQIGGSDQWGNILAGVDLIRRARGGRVHGLSWPLLTAPDGTKLGKTTGARVWLDANRTSPYRFFQHWMQTDDRQVWEMLAKFTLLPLEEITGIIEAHEVAPGRREAQRRLASEVTALVHGHPAASRAEAVSGVLFGGPLDGLDAATFDDLAAEIPTVHRHFDEVVGAAVVDLAVDAEVVASKSEARRLAGQGGLRIGGRQVGPDDTVAASDVHHGRYLLVRRGKSAYHLVHLRA